jgi:hypothetical protein
MDRVGTVRKTAAIREARRRRMVVSEVVWRTHANKPGTIVNPANLQNVMTPSQRKFGPIDKFDDQ